MKLFIDNAPFEGDIEAASMYDVLYKNIKGLIPAGRVVKDIFVNGKKYDKSLADPETSKTFKVSKDGEIKITTMNQKKLVENSIVSAIAFLNELKNGIDKTMDEIKWGNGAKGFNDFSAYLKGLTGFVNIMDKLAEFLKIDYNNYIYGEKSVQAYFGDMERILSAILSTQVEGDYVLLADIAEFELKPHMEVWIGILEDMKEKVGGAPE